LVLGIISIVGMRTASAEGKIAYVIDQVHLQVRRGPGKDYKTIQSIKTGATVRILDDEIGDGYAEIKLSDGRHGYTLKRYLTQTPIAAVLLDKAQKTADYLRKENKKIKAELLGLRKNNSTAKSQSNALIKERNQFADDLEKLQHTAANALDVERQRNDLQERLVNLERNNRHLKLENQALVDKSSHDWFLLGAGVLFAGIVTGLLFTRINWRKKSSSWDTF
jgi:SH3 domain protein